jgi:predicted branched-subunit amino acid permease
MADNPQPKGGLSSKALKLLGIILLLLLVPITMDQFEVDRENLRLAGRIAGGAAGVLFLYGLFSKMLKIVGFVVVLLLIGGVVLVSEQQLKMPRLKQLFAERAEKSDKRGR